MKKIININFQGRVIPIEEPAYDTLKQYIESLRVHFAYEEGRDEIINDIESRIAELFSDRLKRVTSCITDDDVTSVIASIGRPEDLEEAEGPQAGSTAPNTPPGSGNQKGPQFQAATDSRRLFRSENDKVLGGVAAGLANYFGIDPAIMRLIFVLFLFMGFGFLLYIILWIVLPSRSLISNVRKRLYRNPENRMIGGVAGGIAAYLNIEAWILRIIFLLPFFFGVLARIFQSGFDFDPVPNFLFNGFGGTLFIIYIVLWIVLPEATTATEKLEMRGEKVDLESISKTVKEDLVNLKGKAEKFGGEIKERAQVLGQDLKHAGRGFVSETGPVIRRSGSGLGHALGVLFKAFFLFIAGIIVFVLVMVLVTLLSSGVGVFPFKAFLLSGFWQNFLAWTTLILFLGIPVLALLTWLIRRIMGVKSTNHYLGYTFGSLWILGLVSAILLSGLIARSFRSRTSIKEDMSITQPASNKFLVKTTEGKVKYYGSDWFGFQGDWPFFSTSEDSLIMNNVSLNLIKSNDTSYHVYEVKFSNGSTPAVAENLANNIRFPVVQADSVLYLPRGFAITQHDKFRNQQVMLVIEIPVGKKIEVDKTVSHRSINNNDRRGWDMDWDERWNNSHNWNNDREYVMTPNGLEETNKEETRGNEDQMNSNDNEGNNLKDRSDSIENGGYRYKGGKGNKPDTLIIKKKYNNKAALIDNAKGKPALTRNEEEKGDAPYDSPKALYTSVMLFH